MTWQERKDIEKKIEDLPKGNIYTKKIHGKSYEYWQFYQDGKTVSRRMKGPELEILKEQITERKRLQGLLAADGSAETVRGDEPAGSFISTMEGIRTGEPLKQFAEGVSAFRKRDGYNSLHDYVYGPRTDMVFILYGLRRTGKTTLMRQIIWGMPEEMRSRTAFLQVIPGDTLSLVHQKLMRLERAGIQYVFLDEVTLMDDFIEGAAVFSDIFAASGMKIVLSGTDSLGFLFSEDEQLYDRCRMLHTTFIPYREFHTVLGRSGIDEYIRYGGTMSLSGTDYNRDQSPFASEKAASEYVDSAIARNIQHSLRNYQYEGHFRALYDLYEKKELTSAINRVVEDMNHRFTLETMTRAFQSHDLGISRNNLRRDRDQPSSVLSEVDEAAVTERLRQMLEIREKSEMQVSLTQEHIREIQEYLMLLDLTVTMEDAFAGGEGKQYQRTIFTQPGLRYAQASALISSLLQDPVYLAQGIQERTRISERILSEIRGRMMEDIVLLETQKAHPDMRVFPLRFPVGEFDMVVFDPVRIQCRIYEIKHSRLADPSQYRHLVDEQKCRAAELQYGPIQEKIVIYRGEDLEGLPVRYRNVENYLMGLKDA